MYKNIRHSLYNIPIFCLPKNMGDKILDIHLIIFLFFVSQKYIPYIIPCFFVSHIKIYI